MAGTRVELEVVRVVDGDTLKVNTGEKSENLRILALDTEESTASSNKPKTPWGIKAKEEAMRIFCPGDTVVLEFPGTEPLEECWKKYKGNYGRPLVYVYTKDGSDYQEHMIREGFSPYFVKYGFADFPENHRRYTVAEREAQIDHIGVWNQVEVNGCEIRNYALLGAWWNMRAHIIDAYRRYKKENPANVVQNTRLDYERLLEMADRLEKATIFTEMRDFRRAGAHAIIGIGSHDKPFNIFIPEADEPAGQRILNLLKNRYIFQDEIHPGRSYGYVTGNLKMYGDLPEIEVTEPTQITDWP